MAFISRTLRVQKTKTLYANILDPFFGFLEHAGNQFMVPVLFLPCQKAGSRNRIYFTRIRIQHYLNSIHSTPMYGILKNNA
jgi:hypothetical protein